MASRGSAIRETLAALGLIASMIFVGLEIRQNTVAARAATRQAISDVDLEYLSATLDPQTLLAAELKLESGLDLSPDEHFILVERQHVNFRIFENAFYQNQIGLLVDERWETYQRIMHRRFANDEPTQAMWAKYGAGFDAAFQRVVATIRSAEFVPQ